jgi:hypothetical protein
LEDHDFAMLAALGPLQEVPLVSVTVGSALGASKVAAKTLLIC